MLTGAVGQAGQSLTFRVRNNQPVPPVAGDARLYPIPVVAGRQATGRIAGAPQVAESGVYTIAVADLATPAGGPVVPDAALCATLAGGRIESAGQSFQITRAAGGSALTVLARPLTAGGGPVTGPCVLTVPPDYTFVNRNDGHLRRLAAKPSNEDAFGIVTGTPISATHFTDEVPGIGRNRFFYRVRAVDPAENHSDWSAVSVPFRLVDTTRPRAGDRRDQRRRPARRGPVAVRPVG